MSEDNKDLKAEATQVSAEDIAKLQKDVEYWKAEAKQSFIVRNDALHKTKEKEIELAKTQEEELLKAKNYEKLTKNIADKELVLTKQSEVE